MVAAYRGCATEITGMLPELIQTRRRECVGTEARSDAIDFPRCVCFPREIAALLLREASALCASEVAIVVAHPDDESIGLGARLHVLSGARFVHVTDGAPRDGCDAQAHGFQSCDEYSVARRDEFFRAMRVAGIERVHYENLGYPDQQAAKHLGELAKRLAAFLASEGIRVVFTHPYEGGHPDHDATSFAVHAACELLAKDSEAAPTIIEMAFYHQGAIGIETGCFPTQDEFAKSPHEGTLQVPLLEKEQRRKRELLETFLTQRETLGYFPLDSEIFRVAPNYDFTKPPHFGLLFYEQFPWGMTGKRFRELAAEALRNLKLGD